MMHHPVRRFLVNQRDMHSILPPKRRRECISVYGQFQTALSGTFGTLTDPPSLVALATAVGTGVGSVKQLPDLPAARCGIDFLCPQDKVPCPRFQPQPIQKCLFEPAINAAS